MDGRFSRKIQFDTARFHALWGRSSRQTSPASHVRARA